MATEDDSLQASSDRYGGDQFRIVSRGREFLAIRYTHAWRPPTDVLEFEDRIEVVVEIAGMRDGDFHVTFNDRRLTISGSRARVEKQAAAVHQLEVRYGAFRTDVVIPWSVDEDQIRARYDDGFLVVTLSRAKARQIRVVEVDKGLND
ncbi:MAG: Hsp20/alpha crystallin family protein [Chloroflexi bacterium]|nr:Hsp20/alpha crystallin family protein [Chloroflexota bacterium]